MSMFKKRNTTEAAAVLDYRVGMKVRLDWDDGNTLNVIINSVEHTADAVWITCRFGLKDGWSTDLRLRPDDAWSPRITVTDGS